MTFEEFTTKLSNQLETLPERLGSHIWLSLAALSVGILVSIPLGILASKRLKLERFVVTLASVIQTIPSLALLAIMVFAWGKIGWLPAWIALILYSVLPMLRNTITGIQGIDPAYREAALGIGMDWRQMLWKVELPLALPSIIAGVRTASVWVVGAATLAQPVGATSLGNYIFVGLQTSNFVAMVFGCVFSALLALTFDWLLRGLEVAAQNRNSKQAIVVVTLIGLVVVSPFLMTMFQSRNVATNQQYESRDKTFDRPIIIGSKPFTEQYILAELLKRRLEDQGLAVQTKDGMGSGIVFDALVAEEIDCYVDYTGTIWSNKMKRSETVSPPQMLVEVGTYLHQKHHIICLGSLGFSNAYAFAIRHQDAEEKSIVSLFDLGKNSADMTAAADVEFLGRPEWFEVKRQYGFNFAKRLTMDATLMYGAIANQETDVIIAYTTDSRIDANNLSILDDPKNILPPYDAVIVVSKQLAQNPKAMNALRPLIQSIGTRLMRKTNGMVDLEKKSISAACDFLESKLRISE